MTIAAIANGIVYFADGQEVCVPADTAVALTRNGATLCLTQTTALGEHLSLLSSSVDADYLRVWLGFPGRRARSARPW